MRWRRRPPVGAFVSKFELALQQLSIEFLKSSAFQHAVSKGTERERTVQAFLREHLPQTFAIASGEVVDVYDSHSPQIDVLIYDALRNYAFFSGASVVLPAEALLASVEVKSTLTRAEIARSLKAAEALKSLKPFREPVAVPKRDGASRDYKCRYLHSVFAYTSDLAAEGWLQSETQRFRQVAKELGISETRIDRVYVAGRGLLNFPFSIGIEETIETASGLMHLYIDILNFLVRENGARKPVPVMDYAGRLRNKWQPLK